MCGYRRVGATSHNDAATERRHIAAHPAERSAGSLLNLGPAPLSYLGGQDSRPPSGRPAAPREQERPAVRGLTGRPARYEWPSSADVSSSVAGTEPESEAGRSGKGSTRVSSMTGGAGWGVFGMTAASEWPPQP